MAADAPRPREKPGAGARSLLLTVLGEFVLPRGGQVWTGTLVTALGTLGVEEKSARQALSRTAAEGLLEPARHGRRVRWSLTGAGDRLLREGTERIYGFMRGPHDWDGRWLVLTAAVPETQRRLRHRLRTRLTWLGLGSPAPGLWVIPDASKAAAVRDVLRELHLDGRAFAWTGPAADIGDTGELIMAAWDLGDVEKRYLRFIERFERVTPGSDLDAFASQVLLIQEWRRFPFLDPDLPAELLQPGWPGPRAAAVFHDLRNRWHRRAQAAYDAMDPG
ncbi:Phenylacetic acid degradation operon negative regulatory protein paaX [[Actinomadura] parvosata subsp. kistnae]|uniref:PaaX family transcriptional regulator n=1 Tax=[Actinomadura] parvosata subsp. kistnae TaxID=1909395 RepID=A0A1U9ZY10_9ACTN|nr:PaaX family transcriptional regulator C-terminal domain-containing protein [Nonomuraea sp. ATCC 55076]AQZ62838.1 PaaX family transcriptional regulator [Nonomuraea sp. ATCC 55076]SPL98379.1 Phenylacetic acid degradation operon negative regulatory protein paaX [Actinomadura parvosata subsp. kistnae]